MKVTLTQDAEGKKSGDEVDVPADRARWLVAEGYAKADKELKDQDAKADPRLPENVDNEPNKSLAEQMDDGLLDKSEPDEDEVIPVPALDRPQPVAELTNQPPKTSDEKIEPTHAKGK